MAADIVCVIGKVWGKWCKEKGRKKWEKEKAGGGRKTTEGKDEEASFCSLIRGLSHVLIPVIDGSAGSVLGTNCLNCLKISSSILCSWAAESESLNCASVFSPSISHLDPCFYNCGSLETVGHIGNKSNWIVFGFSGWIMGYPRLWRIQRTRP